MEKQYIHVDFASKHLQENTVWQDMKQPIQMSALTNVESVISVRAVLKNKSIVYSLTV